MLFAALRPDAQNRPDTRRPRPGDADRPRDPHLADEITADLLDPGVAHELRTLPEGLAEIVARHLVAADLALVDGDIPAARQVVLHKSAKVEGDMNAPSLIIEEGAIFNGHLSMGRENKNAGAAPLKPSPGGAKDMASGESK